MRLNHRSLELDALDEARKGKIPEAKLATSRHGRIHRPVIRRVTLNDIRWFEDTGYTLTYCKYDRLKYEAIPVQVQAYTWPEIYQAYIEALTVQMNQSIMR